MHASVQLLCMSATLLLCLAHEDVEEPCHHTQLLQTNLHPGKKIIHAATLEAQSDETSLLETSLAVSAKADKTAATTRAAEDPPATACRPTRCRSPYLDVGPKDGRNCSDALFDMLVSVSDKLTAEGYDWQLCQGTLLGAVRDKDIIPWSADVDVCLSEESWLRFQRDAVPEGNGLIGSVLPSDNEQWLSGYNIGYDGKMAIRACENFKDEDSVALDFWDQSMVYMDIVNVATCPWKNQADIVEISQGPKQLVEIRGRLFPAPGDAEAELTLLYGSDWRTPTLDHSAHGSTGCR